MKAPYKTSELDCEVASTAAGPETTVESTDGLDAGSAACPIQPAYARTSTGSQLPRPRMESAGPLSTWERRLWRPRSRRRAGTSPDAPPVIVFVYANDRGNDGRYLRNLPEECRANKAALEDAEDEDQVELVVCPNATREEVITACQKYRVRIVGVHFAGHSDEESLLFERGDGSPTAAAARSFAEFLGELPALVWVFLNGCGTRGQVEALRERGVPVVLATSALVRDDVAQTVSYYFYLELGRGEPIATAFRHSTIDTRFKYSTDRRSPSAGLYRDVDAGSVPTDHVPWEFHGDDAARQYRLVPAHQAGPLDAPVIQPWRASDAGRFRSIVRYPVVTCLIALIIAAAVTAVAARLWSSVGVTGPTAPAMWIDAPHRDRTALAAPPIAPVQNRTAESSPANDDRQHARATQAPTESSVASHQPGGPDLPRPPQLPGPARSPRRAQASAAPRASAERDELASRTAMLPRPSALAELDEETVRHRIRSHRTELKYCYEQRLSRNSELQGRVTTRFVITPAGTVTSLEVSGLDPEVSSCVADTIRSISFPRSSSSVEINYPFDFRRTRSDVQ